MPSFEEFDFESFVVPTIGKRLADCTALEMGGAMLDRRNAEALASAVGDPKLDANDYQLLLFKLASKLRERENVGPGTILLAFAPRGGSKKKRECSCCQRKVRSDKTFQARFPDTLEPQFICAECKSWVLAVIGDPSGVYNDRTGEVKPVQPAGSA